MAPPRATAFKPDQLWQHAQEPLFWLDQGLRFAWVNRAWEELTGHPAEVILGQTCAAYAPADGTEPADVAASFVPPPEAIDGQPTGSLTTIVQASGERLWKRVEFWPVRDRSGALIGLLGQVREAAAPPSVADSRASALRVRLMELRQRLQASHGSESLVGTGPAHLRILDQVRLAANSSAAVLIVGEPGTGKKYLARVIHHLGASRGHALVAIDCEALPAGVIERQLFGTHPPEAGEDHDGAPTASLPGRLSLAAGSTLLISDVLALPRDLQARLASVLDGPVRLIATTSGDPETAMAQERLHPALYYGLSALVLRTLPLRDRRQDVPLLAQWFLERATSAPARPAGASLRRHPRSSRSMTGRET